jgi:glycosyltransferase involved in cell wall biosynthesis
VAVIETTLACDDLYEVIVVNDGSTDNTWEMIDGLTHPKLEKINLEKNSGKAKAIFA